MTSPASIGLRAAAPVVGLAAIAAIGIALAAFGAAGRPPSDRPGAPGGAAGPTPPVADGFVEELVAIVDNPANTGAALAALGPLAVASDDLLTSLGVIPLGHADAALASAALAGLGRIETTRPLTLTDAEPAGAPRGSVWALRLIDAEHLPDDAGRGVIVAVIDTGVADHPAFRGRLLEGYDAPTQRPYRAGEDRLGHGTHVAGIIASSGEGAPPGVAPGSRILPVRAFPPGSRVASSLDVTRAILWSTEAGAQVINLSLGSPSPSPAHELLALGHARKRGVVVVGGAGNCAPRCGRFWPAAASSLGVGAVDQRSARAPFSAIGDHVTVVAPGVEVLSSVPGGQARASGTSMAAPFVSGAVAVLRATALGVSEGEVVAILRRTARPIGSPIPNAEYGAGLIDVGRALGEASRTAPPPAALPAPPPMATPPRMAPTVPTPGPARPTPHPSPAPAPWQPLRQELGKMLEEVSRWIRTR